MGWGKERLFKGDGHMTKMGAMPIHVYGKNLEKSSEPNDQVIETWYIA